MYMILPVHTTRKSPKRRSLILHRFTVLCICGKHGRGGRQVPLEPLDAWRPSISVTMVTMLQQVFTHRRFRFESRLTRSVCNNIENFSSIPCSLGDQFNHAQSWCHLSQNNVSLCWFSDIDQLCNSASLRCAQFHVHLFWTSLSIITQNNHWS